MTSANIIGFSGNISSPSKTYAFVRQVAHQIGREYGRSVATYDLASLGPSFRTANSVADLDDHARSIVESIENADLLVVGSPTYKGSYTGLFKHFFDLLHPAALKGKPVLLTATGGGDKHALMVEHQLRPLFGFFEAYTLPTAIYANDRDFADGAVVSDLVSARIAQAIAQAGPFLSAIQAAGVAAE